MSTLNLPVKLGFKNMAGIDVRKTFSIFLCFFMKQLIRGGDAFYLFGVFFSEIQAAPLWSIFSAETLLVWMESALAQQHFIRPSSLSGDPSNVTIRLLASSGQQAISVFNVVSFSAPKNKTDQGATIGSMSLSSLLSFDKSSIFWSPRSIGAQDLLLASLTPGDVPRTAGIDSNSACFKCVPSMYKN